MAYIGNTPAENYASFLTQTFSVTATASYTLDHAVSNENDIRLVINNVVQQPGSGKAYTASGTTLTLSEATASTDVMYCVYLGRALQTVNPPNASVGTSQLVDGAVTSAKLSSGKVLQVVSTTKTDQFTSTTNTFVDITGLSLAITPSSSSSKIFIISNVYVSHSDASLLALLRDTTAIGSGTVGTSTKRGFAMPRFSATNQGSTFSINFLDSPSSTSEIDYKIQIARTGGAGTCSINRRESDDTFSLSSHITAMEVSA